MTFELTDDVCQLLLAWHMLLRQSAVCNKVWEGWQSIRWKSSKRFWIPQWMWGYLCFTSHCSHIRQSCCGLLFLHQSPSSFFLALITVFFPLLHRDNKTASTSTTLGTLNLYKCTHLFCKWVLLIVFLNNSDLCAQATSLTAFLSGMEVGTTSHQLRTCSARLVATC